MLSRVAFPGGVSAGLLEREGCATLSGVVLRTSALLAVFLASAALVWVRLPLVAAPNPGLLRLFLWAFLGIVVASTALVWGTVWKKSWAPTTAPLYALFEGGLVGLLSEGNERIHPGIVRQAVFLTVAICAVLLVAYGSGWVQVTAGFRRKLSFAIGGVALYYLVCVAGWSLGVRFLPVFDSGVPGILISIVIVGIASTTLISNMDTVVQATKDRLPRYMEWYLAMGLIVALVWLYLEVLRLMAKARKADGE